MTAPVLSGAPPALPDGEDRPSPEAFAAALARTHKASEIETFAMMMGATVPDWQRPYIDALLAESRAQNALCSLGSRRTFTSPLALIRGMS